MNAKDIADALLRLLGILISWPVIFLCVVLLIRRELPALIAKLAERITKAPGGFEFAVLQQKVETLGAKVERLENLTFEPSAALSPELQTDLQSSFNSFQAYLTKLGYESQTTNVRVFVDPKLKNAFYDSESNRIVLGEPFAKDTDAMFREYTNHALLAKTGLNPDNMSIEQQAVVFGLADYFPCSFNNDPLLGKKIVNLYRRRPEYKDKPALRNLKNDRTFDEVVADSTLHNVGEIWGGAFWELRERLGQTVADRLLFSTWVASRSLNTHDDFGVAFVKALLKTDQSLGDGKHGRDIQEIFMRRGLKVKG
jgi:hypothetical protein